LKGNLFPRTPMPRANFREGRRGGERPSLSDAGRVEESPLIVRVFTLSETLPGLSLNALGRGEITSGIAAIA
jgi:hypothetical protein